VTTGSGAASPSPRLHGQFALGEGELPLAPAEWSRHRLGCWTLATHPSLGVVALTDGDGGPRGWLAGRAFAGAEPVTQALVLPVDGAGGVAAAEDALYRLAGRWVALVDLGSGPRLHLDPAGSMAAVYSLDRAMAASTSWLLLGPRYHDALDRTLVADVEGSAPGWGPTYYGGLTAHRSVRRLLPNHLLDLQGWMPRRHWPRGPLLADGDQRRAVCTIGEAMQSCIAGATRLGGIHLSLTAGYDSRMVLACAHPFLAHARLFTTARSRHEVDASVARVMRRRLRLDAELLPVVEADDAAVEAWLTETGHCVGGAIARVHPSLARLDPRRLSLPGLCGELGRATSHAAGDGESVPDARQLLERWGVARVPALVAALQAWVDGLDGQPAAAVRDLFHVEQQLGSWVGPQQYGTVAYSDVVLPMAQRAVLDAMCALPVDYRRRQQLALDLCAERWPELLDFPVNDLAGVDALQRRVRRSSVALPRLVARKARGAARRARRRLSGSQ
jgi:hypothetical protein